MMASQKKKGLNWIILLDGGVVRRRQAVHGWIVARKLINEWQKTLRKGERLLAYRVSDGRVTHEHPQTFKSPAASKQLTWVARKAISSPIKARR